MCKPHWRVYTNALRKAAVARQAEETTSVPEPEVVEGANAVPERDTPAPRKTRRTKAESEDEVTAA